MGFYSEAIELNESAFNILRDLIHERLGLFFENGKRDILADKLSPLVVNCGFSSFLDYYYLLKYDADADPEWERVIDALSTQETYFWREMDQIEALVQVLAPEHFARQPGMPLRIWSAACASGEEPLTIAMALNEAGWFGRAPIEIIASDASPAALAKARKGVYRERSFRTLPERLREKYFVDRGGTWSISPELHARVRWIKANLLNEAEMGSLARSSIIVCRNVFIYFSESTIRRTVHLFHDRMISPGFLLLGASESLLKITTRFDLQGIGGAFVYVKH